ncbi:MAG: hypothetical protein IPJ30_16470 [Acidobacteria bacterium]|nr:hypothetical protein [Acidobacteriota bacterium]
MPAVSIFALSHNQPAHIRDRPIYGKSLVTNSPILPTKPFPGSRPISATIADPTTAASA